MRNPFRYQNRAQSGLATPEDWLYDALGGSKSLSGERIDVKTSTHIADVFACVNFISELVGTLPLKVYYQDPTTGIKTEANGHRMYRILHDAPNSVVPAHRFWATVTADLLLWGNAYIEKVRDVSGLVTELWLYPPQHVQIMWDEVAREKRFKLIGGIAPWAGPTTFTSKELSNDEMLHIYGASVDGLIGMSPIEQCRNALGLTRSRERFESEVYDKKPFVTGVIQHPTTIRDTVKLTDSWRAVFAGKDGKNRHGVPVLEEGATFQQLTIPLQDMQFIESQQLSKTQIATIFKLPPAFIGGSVGNSLTYQTVESNSTWLARYTLTPITTNIQNFINHDPGLFPMNAWEAEFSLDAMLRGDSQARAAFYKIMAEVNALTVNEIRSLENLPPLPEAPTPALDIKGAPPKDFEVPLGPDETLDAEDTSKPADTSPVTNGKTIQVPAHTRRPPMKAAQLNGSSN